MTQFVLDASVALSWVFEDEYSSYAASVAEVANERRVLVPAIWPLEITNALLIAVRRNRITAIEAPLLLDALTRLHIKIDHTFQFDSLARAVLAVGLASRLSSYDASYLELAIRRGLPLATQDTRLAYAAAAAGIELLQP